MDKLLFNAICDMNTDIMDLYLTDTALIRFATVAFGEVEVEENFTYTCWDEQTGRTWREFSGSDGRERLLAYIREKRKRGELKPFEIKKHPL